jgi:predicted phosphodiesterase
LINLDAGNGNDFMNNYQLIRRPEMLRKQSSFCLLLITISISLLVYSTLLYGQTFRYIAYGDSRTNPSDHDAVCTGMNSENPELVISTGDIWDGYTSSLWKGHITSKANLNALLNANKFLVARGNHESEAEVLNISPSIVRNNNVKYSFTQGNCFFVCLSMDPSAAVSYLESQLSSQEAQDADYRFIFHHYPVYSTGSHGATGNAAVEALCDKYNVTISFCGHDHDYQRTKLIYNQKVAYSGHDIPANMDGTIYIVTGGGGAPLRSVGSDWWTEVAIDYINHYIVLDTYEDRLEAIVKDSNGNVIDTFVRRIAMLPGYPSISLLTPEDGTVYSPGDDITVTADVEDTDGTITQVEFFQNYNSICIDTTSPYSTVINNIAAGKYRLTAVVTDNDTQSTTSSAIDIAAYIRPFSGSPLIIPGVIEAENFDNGWEGIGYHDLTSANQGGVFRQDEAVDIENCSQGGYNVGWIKNGEWLEYTVNVTSGGMYQILIETASPSVGGSVRILMDSTDVTGKVSLPATGSWQAWKTTTVDSVTLSAGEQIMRVEFFADDFNFNKITIDDGTSVHSHDGRNITPDNFVLSQNFPNPFNAMTEIRYKLPAKTKVIMQIFNLLGEEVGELVNKVQQTGNHHVSFDASELNSGIYYYTFQAGSYKSIKKMILIK